MRSERLLFKPIVPRALAARVAVALLLGASFGVVAAAQLDPGQILGVPSLQGDGGIGVLQGTGDPVDVVSRDFSFYNETPPAEEVTDVVSREFSFDNETAPVADVTDAVSREFSFYNDTAPVPEVADAVSREFSYQNETPPPDPNPWNVLSREFSFFNDTPPVMEIVDAISREFTVRNAPDDGDVDLSDFGHFRSCFNGPNRAPSLSDCDEADYDNDYDVDLTDFGEFRSCFNGPNRPPACEG